MGNANIILKPMRAIFQNPYGKNEEEVILMLQEYSDALSKFDDEVLTKAWHELRVKCSKMPSLAEIVEVCRSIPVERPQKMIKHEVTIEEIFTSKYGQEALKANNGRNYMLHCKKLNKIVPLDGLFEKWQRQNEEFRREAQSMDGFFGDVLKRSLHSSALMDKELKEKWLNKSK